jgi:hypothetical protein
MARKPFPDCTRTYADFQRHVSGEIHWRRATRNGGGDRGPRRRGTRRRRPRKCWPPALAWATRAWVRTTTRAELFATASVRRRGSAPGYGPVTPGALARVRPKHNTLLCLLAVARAAVNPSYRAVGRGRPPPPRDVGPSRARQQRSYMDVDAPEEESLMSVADFNEISY